MFVVEKIGWFFDLVLLGCGFYLDLSELDIVDDFWVWFVFVFVVVGDCNGVFLFMIIVLDVLLL